ncbi:GNAT family N-acetyltransferase [Haladaptatus sp. W1]|uniref:GNAT family N-acetyltransferase n=1 Tax=Haladaptatus sp. W1 TaxID=1897478 RepID=UPI000849CA86|nr:GNAT family protein [Haladaptatus sp. W1]ODR79607.1 GNAT family N-acetyltransferase [Haladaptatus sp. W1]
MFPERIETDRLVLEAITHENVDVFELYQHTAHDAPHIDEITEHLSWDPHATPKQTTEFIDWAEKNRNEATGAEYVIRPKDGEDGAGEIAGTTGLNIDWKRRTGALGLWLRKPFWGRGYSGERAGALMELAFDRLDLELVAIEHLAGNEKSRRAIEKYVEAHGGQYDGILRNRRPDGDEVRDSHRFTVTREQWEASRAEETS